MKYTIEINATGAAFDGCNDEEVGRILSEIIRTVDFSDICLSCDDYTKTLFDVNGNRCGTLRGVA